VNHSLHFHVKFTPPTLYRNPSNTNLYLYFQLENPRSRNASVGIQTRLWAGRPMNRVSILDRDKRFFSYS
jgi:hypothetical protein